MAVSGGSDSVALLRLMAQAAHETGVQLRAVTVDHRLRPESADEAAFVANLCAGLGVMHSTLAWEHGTLTGNLMEQARLARLGLIGRWARAHAISTVAMGHTADDQAEGFLMGLGRKAGLDGLSGMRRQFEAEGVLWCRPLLDQSRATLRAYLGQMGQDWIEDPSNDNDRFARVRARKALGRLAPLGIGVPEIAASVAHLAMARAELDAHLLDFVRQQVREQAGTLELGRDALLRHPAGLARRFLRQAVLWIGRGPHAPRGTSLDRLVHAATQGHAATLAGVRLHLSGAVMRLTRESRAAGSACAAQIAAGQLWDGRWLVEGPAAHAEIRALGVQGLAQRPQWRDSGLPRDTLIVSPGVWDGTRLIAAPVIEPGAYRAIIRPGFEQFLITH